MKMLKRTIKFNLLPAMGALVLAGLFLSPYQAAGIVLLDTHFAGTGSNISGGTLSGFDYTAENGLTGGSISLTSGNLFTLNQTDSVSHFAPNIQVDDSQWIADLSFTVGASPVTIDSIDVERQNFNNGAAFNTVGTRQYPITVSLIGSTSGSVASATLGPVWNSTSSLDTYNMGGVGIDNTETWSIRIQVNNGSDSGAVYVGLDQLSVEGSIVPEPSVFALSMMGFGALWLLRRRKR
jgi:hypothetical protein